MPTYNQLLTNDKLRKKKLHKTRSTFLKQMPQKRAICVKVTTMSPKKPNSAVRKIARVKLSNGLYLTAYIPGQGHNLQEHSVVLVRGGRVKDLPGINYHLIRGCYDFDWKEQINRMQRRSRYGVPKPKKIEKI